MAATALRSARGAVECECGRCALGHDGGAPTQEQNSATLHPDTSPHGSSLRPLAWACPGSPVAAARSSRRRQSSWELFENTNFVIKPLQRGDRALGYTATPS